jgi:hypothetical protein
MGVTLADLLKSIQAKDVGAGNLPIHVAYADLYDGSGAHHVVEVEPDNGPATGSTEPRYFYDGKQVGWVDFVTMKGGPWTPYSGQPGWATAAQALTEVCFAEPRMANGGSMLGYRHSGVDHWYDTPPGFPAPPAGCVWRSWHQPAQGDPDWFVCVVGRVTLAGAQQNGLAWTLSQQLPNADYLEGTAGHPSADSLVLAGILPPPPPCQYWSGARNDDGSYNVWHSLNVKAGLLAGQHQAAGLAPAPVLCAPASCYWFSDTAGATAKSSKTGASETDRNELRFIMPDQPTDPNAIAAWNAASDADRQKALAQWVAKNLPVTFYGPAGPGGYKVNSSDSKGIRDSGHYWTTDGISFVTGQDEYNLADQVAHIAALAVGPVLIAIGAILALIPGAQLAGAAVAAGGVAATSLLRQTESHYQAGQATIFVPGSGFPVRNQGEEIVTDVIHNLPVGGEGAPPEGYTVPQSMPATNTLPLLLAAAAGLLLVL